MVGGVDLSKVPKGNRASKRKLSKLSAKNKTTTYSAIVKEFEMRVERDNSIDKSRWQSKGIVFMARLSIVLIVVVTVLIALFA